MSLRTGDETLHLMFDILQEALLEHLIVDKAKLDTIEKKTSDKQPQIARIWRLRHQKNGRLKGNFGIQHLISTQL